MSEKLPVYASRSLRFRWWLAAVTQAIGMLFTRPLKVRYVWRFSRGLAGVASRIPGPERTVYLEEVAKAAGHSFTEEELAEAGSFPGVLDARARFVRGGFDELFRDL